MNSKEETKASETTEIKNMAETIHTVEATNEASAAATAETVKTPVKTGKVRNHPVLGHPILGAVLLILHGFFFYQIIDMFGVTEIAGGLLSVVSSVLLLLIHKLWFRREYKSLVSLDFLKERKYLYAIALYILLDVITGIFSYMDHGIVAPCALGVCMALGAGTVEEVVFRALPVSVMMRKYKNTDNYLPALIIPALIFGSIHMINVGSGQSFSMTVLQSVSAAVSGFFFGALFLRTGTIIPSMFVHVIHDILCSLQANQVGAVASGSVTTMDVVTDTILTVVEIVFVIWLLRGHKQEILKTWRGIWNTQTETVQNK